ncbi:hypothetical protein N7468_003152 [Penicillium chermesinum]|uniref:MSP domain-containing protein n=1 Tax=Penicillium chermesinum TaxID=63820 RepID=A0A9W9P5X5_9EURO|nr:uncharacterized protein N7468_003152 [Penicillium chermesinum]KAJ5238533.1 hypothetical protein N7468_003152 [Penicillium chermesinum]
MSVEIDPAELGFKRPFNHEVCEILRLRNNNEEPVVFKVCQDDCPKTVWRSSTISSNRAALALEYRLPHLYSYCVRPNSGRVEPGKQVEVQVLLQAMKEDPAPDAKCKDKFLVQSVGVTKDLEHANVTSIFEQTPKSSVIERKIRVAWLAADHQDTSELNGDDSMVEQPASNSPAGHFQTPAPKKTAADDVSPVPAPEFTEKINTFSAAKTAVANALPSGDDLKAQLADANAQIQRLKDRLADEGLRQRKTATEPKAAPATMQLQHAQTEAGVPLQIVAGLCLLSFLIAYIFF